MSFYFFVFYTSIQKYISLLFLFLSTSLTLSVLISLLIWGNVDTNNFITLYKYPIKYLELLFVSTNFEVAILLKSPSQVFIVFLHHKILLSRNFQKQFPKFFLCYQLFAFKKFCKETRLPNIFKTTNATKLIKAILEGF